MMSPQNGWSYAPPLRPPPSALLSPPPPSHGRKTVPSDLRPPPSERRWPLRQAPSVSAAAPALRPSLPQLSARRRHVRSASALRPLRVRCRASPAQPGAPWLWLFSPAASTALRSQHRWHSFSLAPSPLPPDDWPRPSKPETRTPPFAASSYPLACDYGYHAPATSIPAGYAVTGGGVRHRFSFPPWPCHHIHPVMRCSRPGQHAAAPPDSRRLRAPSHRTHTSNAGEKYGVAQSHSVLAWRGTAAPPPAARRMRCSKHAVAACGGSRCRRMRRLLTPSVDPLARAGPKPWLLKR